MSQTKRETIEDTEAVQVSEGGVSPWPLRDLRLLEKESVQLCRKGDTSSKDFLRGPSPTTKRHSP